MRFTFEVFGGFGWKKLNGINWIYKQGKSKKTFEGRLLSGGN